MGKALYRSYRSKSFDEVVGQEHITSTLSAAIKNGRLSHAYLFTGPRGVGKTSVARILARAVNDLPYKGEDTHLDIIEIDAASNRRIDEIRDLRDKVHISPTSSKYKVYIIDEVHMLTREAFNALLKTLEEPPEHVIFILATTEAHKLPETIISRTQRFNFKSIEPAKVAAHLRAIAKKEKIDVDEPALELIAQHGEGSFRDSISLLDQLAASGQTITAADVEARLGLPKQTVIAQLLKAASEGDSAAVLSVLQDLKAEAADSGIIAKVLAARLRQAVHQNQHQPQDLNLLKQLLEVPSSSHSDELLEIIMLERSAAAAAQTKTIPPQQQPIAPVVKEEPPTPKAAAPKPSKAAMAANFDLTMWEAVLDSVKHKAASLYTALRLASPGLEDGKLKLYFEFPLHQKKINQAVAKELIAQTVEELCGDKIIIECLVDKELVQKSKAAPAPDFYKPQQQEENLATISNIFGTAEVLES